ncbi:MAG: aminotransferase class V-fold PLP-dependent enzyme [Patescibacteria group bacterium]
MKKIIPIFWPYIPKKKILKEISYTLSGRWLGQGPKVDEFERKFGEMFGYNYPLFVNSGTAALELAYHLIGLKTGDQVIVPVLNCTAGQTGLLRRGVEIVFADISKEDLNISFEDIEKKITSRTKAVVAVALGGIDVDERIFPYLKKRGIPLIVDASQHHEPKILEADYVCYSFQAIKHITTCDGGMLCLTNAEEHRRAKLLRWFGIDRDLKAKKNFQAWERRQMVFDIEEAGYKCQPTDIDACFGLAALPDLEKIIKYRQELAEEYRKNLESVKDIKLVYGGSCWLFGILCEKRDALAAYLRDNEIETNMVHLRNDIFSIFKNFRSECPNMDWIHERYLYLPINPKVAKSDVRYICNKIRLFDKGEIKEQFIPGRASKRLEEDHLARYRFAAQFVKDKKVLDIACGSGYGSKFLKESGAKTVDGVDISKEIIDFAKTNYCTDGVNFAVANAETFSPDKRYNVIISFETIECVDDFKAALKNLYNLLEPRGILLISSPNRIIFSPKLKSILERPANPFHAREFTIQELLQELERCGFVMQGDCLFGQRQRTHFHNRYFRRLHKAIFNPDIKASPAVEKIKKTPRHFVIKALKPQ